MWFKNFKRNEITSQIEPEGILTLITKNADVVIKQLETKPSGSLDSLLTKPSETFSFITTFDLEESERKLGPTSSEVYNSVSKRI